MEPAVLCRFSKAEISETDKEVEERSKENKQQNSKRKRRGVPVATFQKGRKAVATTGGRIVTTKE